MKRRGLVITAAVTLCSVLAAGCSGIFGEFTGNGHTG